MSGETERIKERLDVAEIVGEYVPLKRAGNHFKGLCPFHQEKTPSFIVSPDKGIWHCFGCHKGGDVFSFVQDIEGLDFPAALKMLAERAGVTLQMGAPVRHDPRARQFELHALAARFYHELLMNQKVGAKAKEYLRQRGVTDETMQTFEIGYAPQRWDSLQLFLQQKGFSDQEMSSSGLIGQTQHGKAYDRFRGRIMFPIHDIQGRAVAFGGRIVPWHATGEEGKYINSPETAIYAKRRVVYNLSRAKRSLHQQPCIVVEGYMDVVLLVQSGVANVVASSGTAFTAEQIALLQRYTNTLHFAFDADAAGVQAAQAATREAIVAGLRVAIIVFPLGLDPADVAHQDPEQLRAALASPTSLVAMLLRQLHATAGADREKVLTSILPLVQQTTNAVQQGEMIQELANTLHVTEAAIMARLSAMAFTPPWAGPISADAATVSGDTSHTITLSSDQLLLGLVLIKPGVRSMVAEQVSEDHFATDETRSLWQALHEQQLADAADFINRSTEAIIDALPEPLMYLAEALRRVTEEYLAHSSTTPLSEAKTLLRSLKTQTGARRLKTLRDRLPALSGAERAAALQEFQALLKELSTTA